MYIYLQYWQCYISFLKFTQSLIVLYKVDNCYPIASI